MKITQYTLVADNKDGQTNYVGIDERSGGYPYYRSTPEFGDEKRLREYVKGWKDEWNILNLRVATANTEIDIPPAPVKMKPLEARGDLFVLVADDPSTNSVRYAEYHAENDMHHDYVSFANVPKHVSVHNVNSYGKYNRAEVQNIRWIPLRIEPKC